MALSSVNSSVVYNDTSTSNSYSGQSFTVNGNTGNAVYLFAFFCSGQTSGSEGFSSITLGGVAPDFVSNSANNLRNWCAVARWDDVSAGSKAVALAMNQYQRGGGVIVWEVDGFGSQSTINYIAEGDSATGWSPTRTTTVDGSWLLGSGSPRSDGGVTLSGGGTSLGSFTTGGDAARDVDALVAYEAVPTPATESFDLDWTTDSRYSGFEMYIEPAGGGGDDLTPNDISSASSVSTPAIGQAHGLTASDVSAASSVDTPAIGQVHGLTASDVASASTVSTPAIGQAHSLTASDVSSASSVDTPSLGQAHSLTASDVASASSVDTPAIGQVHVLAGSDVSSASSVSAPAISTDGTDALTADDVQAASSVDTPAIGQVHSLAASDVASGSSVSSPSIGTSGIDNLSANDVAAASGVSAPAMGQTHSLAALGLSAQPAISVPALGQVHGLTGADVSSASSLSLPVLADIGAFTYFYSYPEDSARGGTLISPTRGGTLSRYEV